MFEISGMFRDGTVRFLDIYGFATDRTEIRGI